MNLHPPGTFVHEFLLHGKAYVVVHIDIMQDDFVTVRQYRLNYPDGTCRVLLDVTPDTLLEMTKDIGADEALKAIEKRALGEAMDVLAGYPKVGVGGMVKAELKPIMFDPPQFLNVDFAEMESKCVAAMFQNTHNYLQQAKAAAEANLPLAVVLDSFVGSSPVPTHMKPLPPSSVQPLPPPKQAVYGPSPVVSMMKTFMKTFEALYGGKPKVTPKVLETLTRFGAVLAE